MANLVTPNNYQEYYDRVIYQSNILIKLNIWTISDSSFNAWIHQFQTQEEKYFCACLLSRLVFRSKNQINALISSILSSNLNNYCFDNIENQGKLIQLLTSKRVDPRIRLIPVINEEDPPTKSGPLVIRYTKKRYNLNEKWMIWSSMFNSLLESEKNFTFIFIDDFCGTGKQFDKFFSQIAFKDINNLEDIKNFWERIQTKNIKIIYCPLIAYESGFNYLRFKYPFLKFTSSELLTSYNNFFDDNNWKELSNDTITSSNAKQWLKDFWQSKGFEGRSIPYLGYENMALTIGFEHGTPNNTLPIFWQSNNNWKPLLER